MKTKNNFFSVKYTDSFIKLTFNSVPDYYFNHTLHYVISSKEHEFYSTETPEIGYWYLRTNIKSLQFDYIRLYAFSMDDGMNLIDEYDFNIKDYNFMFNLKTNNLNDSRIWGSYIYLYNQTHGTNFKYYVNMTEFNDDLDNFEISREKYNIIYNLESSDLNDVPSVEIIKKFIGSL